MTRVLWVGAMATLAFVLAAPTAGAVPDKSNVPPREHIDSGACPFECCTYRDWKALKDVILVSSPRSSTLVARVPAGQTVKAITGQVISRPKLTIATQDLGEGIKRGDAFYLLHYDGEGYYSVWLNGRVLHVQPGQGEEEWRPEAVWWAQVRTSEGRVGWALVTDNFGNQDFLRLTPFVLIATAIRDELAATDAGALRRLSPDAGEPRWLAEVQAVEIPIHAESAAVLGAARAAFARRAVDINVMPAANRRKKLLIADMDSTIINCEVVDELADFAHVKAEVAAITERAVNGEIEFGAAVRQRVALLKGLPLDRLARVYAERIRLNPGARALVATMRAHGAYTMLVSGGFEYFTARVAADTGFDFHLGNRLIDDGRTLTGEVGEPVLGREAKLETLKRAATERGVALADALAVGDGANDLDMIRAAGLGVAYHAKPIVAAAAGASIVHGDLTALLYLQGYGDGEIVRP